MTEPQRPGAAADPLGEALSNYFERLTGGQRGDVGRAASAAQAFLVFSALLTALFTGGFAAYDAAELAPIIVVGAAAVIANVVGIVVVRRGRQLTASVIAVTAGTAQVVFVSTFIGWLAGFQLYLLAGGQLVFMLFTERQRLLRWVYVAIAIVSFIYCQLIGPSRGLGYAFPDEAYAAMFSVNATLTLLLIVLLGAASHYGALRARSEAAGAAQRAEFLANTDELTGLANRRPVLKRLEQLSSTVPYILALADLDNFKQLNDTFGHECGDRVLAAVGARLRAGLRAGDSVGRWGGEEFIFVMEQSTIDDAIATIERLRAELAEPIPCSGHEHEVTMSVGVTDAQPDRMVHRAIQRADSALYEAKAAGRDAVRVSGGPPPIPGVEPPQRRRRS